MQVLCGQCGHTIKIEDEDVGTDVLCPKCEHEISVPRFDEIDENIDDLDDSAVYDLEDEEEGFADQVKQAMSRKVQVVCGSCNRGLSVSSRLSGKNARCPACGVKIRIPYPDEEADEYELQHQTATQTQQTEKLDLSGPEAEFVQSEMAQTRPLRRPQPRKDPRTFWIGLAAVAAAALVIGIWVGSLVLGPSEPADGPADDPGEIAKQPDPTPPGPTPPGPTPPGPKTPGPKPGTKPAPVAPKGPTVALVAERADTFAANGYFPAAPDKVYWHMTAVIEAGPKPVELNTFGKDVTLTVGGQSIPSAGLLPGPLDPPMRGKRMRLSVPPNKSREVSFVFEVPVAARGGTLKVGASPAVNVKLTTAASPTTAAKLAGTYVEAPPRNLKPLLRDPVMRAIQTAAKHRLLLDAEGDDLKVAIPEAGVTGVAKNAGGGLYTVSLARGDKTLACKLRTPGGLDTAILYLKDDAFHQITYLRQGVKARPRPKPVVTPKPKPVVPKPKPVVPKPTPVRPKPEPREPGSKLPRDHGRPTIFD